MTLTDQEALVQEPDEHLITKAQQATIRVLDGGILPHDTSERDHADALMNPVYRVSGGKGYAERIALLNKTHIIIDKAPAMTLHDSYFSSKGIESDETKALRRKIEREQHDGIVATVADRMMSYVEDAAQVIDDVNYLEGAIEPFHETQPLGPLVQDPKPEVARALAALTRLYETQLYATQTERKRSRMNADLNETNDAYAARIIEATHDLTIGEVRREIAELLRLEFGRLEFWHDQLMGHPDRPAVGDKEDEGHRPAVRERHGVVETDNPVIRDTILKRMAGIAAGKRRYDLEQ
jgi:hypothetical protein